MSEPQAVVESKLGRWLGSISTGVAWISAIACLALALLTVGIVIAKRLIESRAASDVGKHHAYFNSFSRHAVMQSKLGSGTGKNKGRQKNFPATFRPREMARTGVQPGPYGIIPNYHRE